MIREEKSIKRSLELSQCNRQKVASDEGEQICLIDSPALKGLIKLLRLTETESNGVRGSPHHDEMLPPSASVLMTSFGDLPN